MGFMISRSGGFLAICLSLMLSVPANAQQCNHTQSFANWLAAFKQQASAAGISDRAINAGLSGVDYDPSIVRKDRSQGVFAQDFLTFSGRMVSDYRMKIGKQQLKKHQTLFQRIESEYGVPGPVIVGFWGLETDFGVNTGKSPIMGALATLAYDCRRPEMFHDQLLAALKIIDRGYLSRDEMIGAWAGELGQTQFLPTHYVEYGVDYDSDGRIDLRGDVADVLASTANLLKAHGWRAGEPWIEEVRVPSQLDWQEADLTIKHPRSKWADAGVTYVDGSPLPSDNMPTSLILPMGRNGTAFISYANFDVYTQWNESLVYATTAAYYATRLNGAPRYNKGARPVQAFGLQEVQELQNLLNRLGYDVGKADGIIGARTRAAIRDAQLRFDLPADSYPSDELLARLRAS